MGHAKKAEVAGARRESGQNIAACFIVRFLVVVSCCALNCHGQGGGNVKVRDCEPIRIKICSNLGYNLTGMPNLVGFENQDEAEMQLNTFRPLITYGCSSSLRLFLCSVYVPMCTEKVLEPIGPCRPLCEHVQGKCQPILRSVGFAWPDALNCSKFPVRNNHDHMCMEGDDPTIPNGPNTGVVDSQPTETETPDKTKCGHYRNSDKYIYINRTDSCVLLCDVDDIFSQDDKYFADIWMAIWAGLCFVSTLFTVLTFAIDADRFKYPERPIILLALCYNLLSIGYVIRLAAGRVAVACGQDSVSKESILVQEGLDNTDCAIVFLLQYYFSMAGLLWWVILTFNWFLAAGLKWSPEAIQRHATYFHVAAWALPAIKTIAVLVLRAVEADELTGLCFVGSHRHRRSLLALVVVPLCIYLVVGTSFLLAGLVSLCRIRRQVHQRGEKTTKLEMLIVRIGIFSILYTVPVTCLVACFFYEYSQQKLWHQPVEPPHEPNMEIFMLKIFMSLVVGITSGMWIWSQKTISAWRGFFLRFCGCRRDSYKNSAFPPYRYHPPKQHGVPGAPHHISSHIRTLSQERSHNPKNATPSRDVYPKTKRLKNGRATVV